jgi:ribosomal protein L37AE/L43A
MAKGGESKMLGGQKFPSLHAFNTWSGLDNLHRSRGIDGPKSEDIANVAPIVAHISDDTWCADCPDCGGAETVWLKDLKMWCHSCGNVTVGGKYRPVALPPDAPEIERILDKRPLRHTRNWRQVETVDDLRAQNKEAGDRP